MDEAASWWRAGAESISGVGSAISSGWHEGGGGMLEQGLLMRRKKPSRAFVKRVGESAAGAAFTLCLSPFSAYCRGGYVPGVSVTESPHGAEGTVDGTL